MSSEAGSGKAPQDYLGALNQQLKKVPRYNQRVKGVLSGQRALSKELRA
jgi:hypothetical protein